MWGQPVQVPKNPTIIKDIINQNLKVTIEDTVFRNKKFFKVGHLKNHIRYWKEEILKDHPNKNNLLG